MTETLEAFLVFQATADSLISDGIDRAAVLSGAIQLVRTLMAEGQDERSMMQQVCEALRQ